MQILTNVTRDSGDRDRSRRCGLCFQLASVFSCVCPLRGHHQPLATVRFWPHSGISNFQLQQPLALPTKLARMTATGSIAVICKRRLSVRSNRNLKASFSGQFSYATDPKESVAGFQSRSGQGAVPYPNLVPAIGSSPRTTHSRGDCRAWSTSAAQRILKRAEFRISEPAISAWLNLPNIVTVSAR